MLVKFTMEDEFEVTGRGLVLTGPWPGASVEVGDYFLHERTGHIVLCRGVETFRPVDPTGLPIGILLGDPYPKGFFQRGDVFTRLDFIWDPHSKHLISRV